MQKVENFIGRKNNDPDLDMFLIGMELTNFGLNLVNPEKIYPLFGSPFSANPTRKCDPHNLAFPDCYSKPQITLTKAYFKKFPVETLFYVFYNYGEEAHRFNATEELYEKGWKYHYPTETWILEQPTRKYFNTQSWLVEDLKENEINADECLTLKDFELQSNPQ
mgnify:CR=1 FL=1